MSIIEELRDCPLTDGSNVLILVDQFEELFRYQDIPGLLDSLKEKIIKPAEEKAKELEERKRGA